LLSGSIDVVSDIDEPVITGERAENVGIAFREELL
jgi:hypothetical protein